MKYFIYIVIAVVAASIVAGFFIVGSPKEERARRFDEQRIQSLQFIQSQIGEFYRAKERLPQNLAELNDEFRGVIVPQDPETGEEFGYETRGPLIFALCADFNRPSLEQSAKMPKPPALAARGPYVQETVVPRSPFGQEIWEHAEGRACFERTIDKDFFKFKQM